MFIIWGTRWILRVIRTGRFYCPNCIEVDVPFELKEGREWFTLYFIPVFPVTGRKRFVECKDCKGAFQEGVLDLEPPTEAELEARQRAADLGREMARGMSLEAAEKELVAEGFSREAARGFVDAIVDGDFRECESCRRHYAATIKRCPRCGERTR